MLQLRQMRKTERRQCACEVSFVSQIRNSRLTEVHTLTDFSLMELRLSLPMSGRAQVKAFLPPDISGVRAKSELNR